ncbi:hypothetical protein [Pseudoalteromonas marina]|uniref:Uncharacterized protein n=1 Tax=Pseudoalteromonas marina TaxID=267375 RepID=A0ABT9FH42_9GAMM|nr:hypothetical protein [Pseudoalteromonas marina]MDP2484973.1 hypothetical protein [Pseudoalteromonas marina]MDP2566104.1 hypothetical protein [Pseudoalteromonas marina]
MNFKNGFKFGVGLFTSILLCTIVVTKVFPLFENSIHKSQDITIDVLSINHWFANATLTFVGEIAVTDDVEWSAIELIFELRDKKGHYLGECSDFLVLLFRSSDHSKYKAQCHDLPSDFEFENFQYKAIGQYEISFIEKFVG